MGVQLLSEVVGVAIAVLTFSVFCLLCSSLMIYLVVAHDQKLSYVALLSYFTFISTAASIIQQIHTIIDWRDVQIAEWKNAVAVTNAETICATTSVGVDLFLFYIQYYSYNVEAVLSLFWAVTLTLSVFGFSKNQSTRELRDKTSTTVKTVAVVFPAVLISLLQLKAVQKSLPIFLLLANINMMLSLTLGSILLFVVLGKYIQTRRQLRSWNVPYGNSTETPPVSRDSMDVLSRQEGGKKRSIYDQWLVVRFSVGFVVLSIFELTMILYEISGIRTYSKEDMGDGPDFSAAQARSDFLAFIPGCCASILVFVVFGTTKPFRDTMKDTFIPARLRRKRVARLDFADAWPAQMQSTAIRIKAPEPGDDLLWSPTSPTTQGQTVNFGPSVYRMRELQGQRSPGLGLDRVPIQPMSPLTMSPLTMKRMSDNMV